MVYLFDYQTENNKLRNEWKAYNPDDFDALDEFKKNGYSDINDISVTYTPSGDRIAFFISAVDHQRYQPINTTGNKSDLKCLQEEHASPGLLLPNLTLHSKSTRFHGQRQGNTNTDIYYTMYNKSSYAWSAPKLLNEVSTSYSERAPIYIPDEGRLYFSSEGQPGLGGFDVFSVSIQIDQDEVRVTGRPENTIAVNSVHNDLFYNKGLAEEGNYLVSDRQQDGYYRMYKSTDKTIIPQPPPPPPLPSDGANIIEIAPGVKFTLDCVVLPFDTYDPQDGKIPVIGTVYDENKQRAKKAKIIFLTNEYEKVEANIGITNQDTIYKARLHENRTYAVQVFTYDKDGNDIEAYVDNILLTCEKGNEKNKVVRYDPVVKKVDYEPSLENAFVTKIPFFFGTGSDTVLDRDIQKEGITEEYYLNILHEEILNPDKNYCLLLRAYADHRGSDSFNCRLSEKRAFSVRDYLLSLGFPNAKIKVLQKGETKDFSKENIDDYRKILFNQQPGSYNLTGDLILNRRVTVTLLPGCDESKIGNPCNSN